MARAARWSIGHFPNNENIEPPTVVGTGYAVNRIDEGIYPPWEGTACLIHLKNANERQE